MVAGGDSQHHIQPFCSPTTLSVFSPSSQV